VGKKALSQRTKWQDTSGLKAEKDFFHVFGEFFRNSEFVIQAKPKDFRDVYSSIQLPPGIQSRIYNPDEQFIVSCPKRP
jgi:hypothetical protein